MEFHSDQQRLAPALTAAARIATGALSAAPHMHLSLVGDVLTATGTDGDRRLSMRVDVFGGSDGEVLLPANRLRAVVGCLPPEDVSVVSADGEAEIACGEALRFRMSTIDLGLGTWPDPPDVDAAGPPVLIPSSQVVDVFGRAAAAASRELGRPALCGVAWVPDGENGSRGEVVATDSYRMARLGIPGKVPPGEMALIPATTVQEMVRIIGAKDAPSADVEVSVGEQWARFQFANATLLTRLIAAEFPNYRSLFDTAKSGWHVGLDRDETLEALSRVAVMSADGEPIKIEVNASTLRLSADSLSEGGHATAEIAHMGLSPDDADPAAVLFNHDRLRQGLKSFKGSEVTMIVQSVDTPKPVLLEDATGDDDYQYLLMPMGRSAQVR